MIKPRFYKAGEVCPGDNILVRPWLYAFEEDNTVVPGIVKSTSYPAGTITEISFVSSMTDQVHTARMGNFWKLEDAFDSGIDMDMDIGVDRDDPEDIKRRVQPELFGGPIYRYGHLGCQREEVIKYYDYPVLVFQNDGRDPFFVIVGVVIEHQLESDVRIRPTHCGQPQWVDDKLSYVIPLSEKHLKVVEQLARCRGFHGKRMGWPKRNDYIVWSLDIEAFENRLCGKRKDEFIHACMRPDGSYKLIPYMGKTILSFEAPAHYGSGYYSVVVGVIDNYKFKTTREGLPISAITIIPDHDRMMVEKELRKLGLRAQ